MSQLNKCTDNWTRRKRVSFLYPNLKHHLETQTIAVAIDGIQSMKWLFFFTHTSVITIFIFDLFILVYFLRSGHSPLYDLHQFWRDCVPSLVQLIFWVFLCVVDFYNNLAHSSFRTLQLVFFQPKCTKKTRNFIHWLYALAVTTHFFDKIEWMLWFRIFAISIRIEFSVAEVAGKFRSLVYN